MSQFEYPLWISILFWFIPLTIVVWLVGMWATHEDYKKEHNIIGWSDRDMNLKQLIAVTVVSTIVGISGYLVGTYYGAISMLDTMYGNVESELNILESKLKDVNTREVESKLEEIKTKVLNKVPSKESIAELNIQIKDFNTRLLLLSHELMEVHMELEMELSNLEDNTKAFINDKVTQSEVAVKKQFGEMYDKLDVLYKDLENISNTIDVAKETFLGKYIIKE